ncbi:p115 like vesicle tethering protein [Lipomyces orientalis]|uniref:P115 like vesicle tethering protein n=1 Tax=Lipomyces orientalis TaxID=1233043 RepID=A0ACC3TI06_9ASCO
MQDLLSGILAQTQPKQNTTATDTITKLCDRLLNSTLLEDRRAAVLGLKGFCREYREAVVTGGLRGLIAELQRDRLDTETVRATLETVLLLFMSDNASKTADVDYIALWLADEFTQREENITLLIDILENNDFYVRLYTLQLLAAILSNRTERTQQCVFAAPLGISRLVSTLDDHREAIQNDAVMLLLHLVDGHPDIQKLVAFENTFDKTFIIIEREGGVEGGVMARDCLRLIANLLRFNPSNQNLFRETSCIPRLSNLMIVGKGDTNWDAQKVKNLILVLEICRLFVVEGSLGTPANQNILFQAGVLMNVLRLAFADSTNIQVRAMALVTTGDLIRGNEEIQEKFANIDVPYINVSVPGEPNHIQLEAEVIPVIQALLNWTLSNSSIYAFDLRVGASMCLEAYFSNNNGTRIAFLEDAMDAYFNDSRSPKNAKLLSALLDHETDARTDPYRTWFACVIMLHIFEGGQELKDLARSITIGDEEQGEEVVTAIQTVSANLVASLQYNLDTRIPIAYIMLLSVWLYEDYDAIDDFLSEGSSVQSLVADVSQSSSHDVLVEGMCTTVLAVLYGYSTTSSPVPRPVLHRLLISRIGRDSFIMKLRLLRRHSLVRDFNSSEILSAEKDATGLPKVFFNRVFIDFFKDRYSRLEKVLDKDPNRDPISPEAIEAQNELAIETMENLQKELEALKSQLAATEGEKQKTEESLAEEKQKAETSLASSAVKMDALSREREKLETELQESESVIKKLQDNLAAAGKELTDEREKSREIERKLGNTAQSLGMERNKLEKRVKELDDSARRANNRIDNLEKELGKSKERALQAESALRALKESSTNERAKLESKVKQSEESKTFAHSMLEESEKKNKQLSSKSDQLQTLLDGFKTKANELQSKIDSLQSHDSDKDRQLDNLQSEITKKQVHISALQAELNLSQNALDDLRSETATLRNRLSSAEEELKDSKERFELDLKSSQEKLAGEASKSVYLQKELDAKKAEVETLQSSLKESEEKMDDLLLVLSDLEDKLQKNGEEGEENDAEGDDEEEEEDDLTEEVGDVNGDARLKMNGSILEGQIDEDTEDEVD